MHYHQHFAWQITVDHKPTGETPMADGFSGFAACNMHDFFWMVSVVVLFSEFHHCCELLVGGFNHQPIWKNIMLVKLDHFPQVWWTFSQISEFPPPDVNLKDGNHLGKP